MNVASAVLCEAAQFARTSARRLHAFRSADRGRPDGPHPLDSRPPSQRNGCQTGGPASAACRPPTSPASRSTGSPPISPPPSSSRRSVRTSHYSYGSASEVTFVRSPIGPRPTNGPAPTGLEIIRYAESADEDGLIRSRVPFTPLTAIAASSPDFEFSDASLLLRAPLKVSFGFAGRDRVWTESWSDEMSLPSAIRITLRNGASDEILAVSTANPRPHQRASLVRQRPRERAVPRG